MSDELKYCKFCDKEKPKKEFCKSGFAIKNICRECQNKKQKDKLKASKNWNELKSWLKEQYKLNDLMYYNDIDIVNPKKARIEYISKREELKEVLDKMQELEGNNE